MNFAIDPTNTAQTDPANAGFKSAEDANNAPLLQGLAGHVRKCWEAARTAKSPILERLLAAQRARRGEYAASVLAEIRKLGGSEEYGRVVSNKCRIAEAWLRDVYLGQTEQPWTLVPTPSPSVPDTERDKVRAALSMELAEVFAVTSEPPAADMIAARTAELEDAVQERIRDDSRKAVERMERVIGDQLTQGGFHDALGEFLNDFTTFPAAHFKGPIYRKRTEVQWKQGADGQWQPQVAEIVAPEFSRIDPFRAYPSPGATGPQSGYFIEHITLSRGELYDLIGAEGFSEEAIREVLRENTSGGLSTWLGLTDASVAESEKSTNNTQNPDVEIDCLEFHGPVSGKDLIEWGVAAEEVTDADRDYESCVWLIGRWVIKAQLNYDPLNRRPIRKASWEEIPGEYWGQGLPDSLADVSGVVNAAIRALVNNMAMASGPQVAVNVDRLPPGEELTAMHPWKVWQVQESQFGSSAPPIDFFQPNSNISEIIAVLDKFYQFADDWSLIPRYMGGSAGGMGEVGRTASGLSMLFSAANKGLKGVVSTIDARVISPTLEMQYTNNMLYSDDQTLKGDASVVARGAVSLMQLETLQLRRNEFLTATANPMDSQIVGLEGRAEILREVAKGLQMDINKVVPKKLQQPAPPQPQPGGQQPPAANQETLQNGAAVTDNFSPNSMRSV